MIDETPLAVFKPYAEHADAEARELSAVRMAQAILQAPEVTLSHRKHLLTIAVWKYSEARAGKYGVRFRTPAALRPGATGIQHEHVRPRKVIVDDLLRGGPLLAPLALGSAVSCLVTAEEHARLNSVPAHLVGWSRYVFADLTVVDVSTGLEVDPGELDTWAFDIDTARSLTPGGPSRICLLSACRLLEENVSVGEALALGIRDSESVEATWMLARHTGLTDNDETPWENTVSAMAAAGRMFSSSALDAAVAVLTTALNGVAEVAETDASLRRDLASRLAACADRDVVGRADPAAAPLVRAAILAADSDDVPQWPDFIRAVAGGRYRALAHDPDGGAREEMRQLVRSYADPVLDLALTLFEKRTREALRQPLPQEVIDWAVSRC